MLTDTGTEERLVFVRLDRLAANAAGNLRRPRRRGHRFFLRSFSEAWTYSTLVTTVNRYVARPYGKGPTYSLKYDDGEIGVLANNYDDGEIGVLAISRMLLYQCILSPLRVYRNTRRPCDMSKRVYEGVAF